MSHVFLSGRDDIDRSAIVDRTIQKLEQKKIYGFRTVSVESKIENASQEVYIIPWGEKLVRDEKYLVGVLWNDGIYTAFPEVFDNSGLAILKAIPENADLIVMDEVDLFVMAAPLFSTAVLKQMEENTPVFGVLQRKDTPFHDAIRNNPSVTMIEVSEVNLPLAHELALKALTE